MKMISRSNKPVNPSIFYGFSLTRSQGYCYAPISFNCQQDATEVLQFVIDKLKGSSVAASGLISNTIRINVSCNQCFCFSAKEEKLDILTIPLLILLFPNF